jgi:hypothetical protein
MKNIKFLLLSMSLIALSTSCEDDDPISAGEGDPLLKSVVALEATVSTQQLTVGEGNVIDFSVTLPNSFDSDADVTVRVLLDNGLTNTGTASVAAGSTTGTGSLTMPPDDNLLTGETIDGALNAAELFAEAILLDELVPGTTYTLSSNVVDLNIYPRTLAVGGGVNILSDWNGAPAVDLDMYVYDSDFNLYEVAESGSRFETDLFQNVGRPDRQFFVWIGVWNPPADGSEVPYVVLITMPDGRLVDVRGVIPAGAVRGDFFQVATFEKTTDVETGVVSYINVGAP